MRANLATREPELLERWQRLDIYGRLRAVLPDVTVVENRKQRGLSGGKNTGVEVTSSDVVVFLDDDAVAHPDWLRHFRDA